MSSQLSMNRLLVEMRAMQAEAMSTPLPGKLLVTDQAAEGDVKQVTPSFGDMFKQAINEVNTQQQISGQLRDRYDRGDTTIDLPQVMVESQKAKVAFDAMVEVRNKLVSAYEEIMKMPI
ncbi:flagellar hook-basal body complex protein FliE [Endozoicomonas sp. SM1973]|uniref:Flagellar hook-basal body complex protein FliE n=1 Tax=Spartinivicinus marinus TaxID=2994442 RepID=A0A853I7I9_9GAMM|nr:flagellar hook-basal body complex protein FliE [Spartinivicinus marinus]MCX4028890.1 flagellar hook-basal body complex protein FliE [Spartinivicinus marinus]NYZ65527.1 flagellar hook-basal body complex protein FliE [Spartinivicinus marinus]